MEKSMRLIPLVLNLPSLLDLDIKLYSFFCMSNQHIKINIYQINFSIFQLFPAQM